MHNQRNQPVSGHVARVVRKRGPQWYARYRLPDGRQIQRRLGPEWTGKGRPPAGYFTRRTAEAKLQEILTDARRGTLAGMVQTGATFADAAAEWLRHGEQERHLKPSTLRDYHSAVARHLLPAFGELPLERVTARAIEAWRADGMASGVLPRRTAIKLVAIMYAIFERARRVHGLPANPIADVERLRERYDPGDYDFYDPEEVWALVRAAASEQDGAIYLTAAFTGLRLGELLALRVRDVDFQAEGLRVMGSVDPIAGVGTTKGGRGRAVPMVAEVAQALARQLQRQRFTGADDLVFPSETGEPLDGSALRRRYRAAQGRAGLRPLRFHDLRHTFGSLAITRGSTVQVQAWMGHADARTTARYTHYRSRANEASLLADAFRVEEAAAPAGAVVSR